MLKHPVFGPPLPENGIRSAVAETILVSDGSLSLRCSPQQPSLLRTSFSAERSLLLLCVWARLLCLDTRSSSFARALNLWI